MKIEQARVDALVAYAFNNRTHGALQVDRIAQSIVEFGFNQPLVVDENNIVIVGHGRLEAAKKLKLETVPVVRLESLTEAQKKAYRILDNKLQNDSDWDLDNLRFELDALEELGFDVEPWGLGVLTDLFDEEEPEIVEDDFEGDLEQETYIKTGDLIELGEHRLLCGDSTKAEDVQRVLINVVPEMMVTDPPYGVEYDANWRTGAKNADGSLLSTGKGRAIGIVENDDCADWSTTWNLFAGDIAYVWHAGLHSPLVAATLEKQNFERRALIIWAKNNLVVGRGDYHHQHEPCWYCVRKHKTGKRTEDRTQTTLWEIDKPKKSYSGHSTQKPIECMARPIKNHNIKTVYDPFLGSGTTLIAAEQLGRICYGMEISPQYCQVIIDRYKAHCEKVGKAFVCRINGENIGAKT